METSLNAHQEPCAHTSENGGNDGNDEADNANDEEGQVTAHQVSSQCEIVVFINGWNYVRVIPVVADFSDAFAIHVILVHDLLIQSKLQKCKRKQFCTNGLGMKSEMAPLEHSGNKKDQEFDRFFPRLFFFSPDKPRNSWATSDKTSQEARETRIGDVVFVLGWCEKKSSFAFSNVLKDPSRPHASDTRWKWGSRGRALQAETGPGPKWEEMKSEQIKQSPNTLARHTAS